MKNKIVAFLDHIEDAILVTMFSGMVLVIFYQVIMRYVFNNSSSWSEELGKFLFVWISWLGISIGQRRLEHIKISLLVDKMPYKAAQIVNILTEFIVITVAGVTAWYSLSLVISQNRVHFAGIKISMSWGYLAVFVGCTLMCIRCLYTAYRSYRAFVEGPKPAVKEEGGEA